MESIRIRHRGGLDRRRNPWRKKRIRCSHAPQAAQSAADPPSVPLDATVASAGPSVSVSASSSSSSCASPAFRPPNDSRIWVTTHSMIHE